jgi:hypothetical protein
MFLEPKEQGSILITSNRAFKEGPKIFNNASTLATAIFDRLLHHAETVVIEGKSFRMKGKIEPSACVMRCRQKCSQDDSGRHRRPLVGRYIFKLAVFLL